MDIEKIKQKYIKIVECVNTLRQCALLGIAENGAKLSARSYP